MYTVIRKYNIFPKTIEEFIQDVQEHLLHILRQIPGFRGYYLVDAEDNEVVVITIFDSLADAKEAARLTMDWVGKHPELYFQGFSKPLAGQMKILYQPYPLSLTSSGELPGVF